jgi:large subunit ribosomal protein L25
LETLEIKVDPREKKNKREARRLLRSGKIPAILYGPKTAAVALALDKREFSSRVADLEGSHLVRLKSDSAALADKVALVKEMQFHPISGEVIHTDLYEVDLTARITVHVPLHFVGEPIGVKEEGGLLVEPVREITVLCEPGNAPTSIDVDVSSLGLNESLHVSDIKAPEGVEIHEDADTVIASVTIVKEPELEPQVAEGAEPEVEGGEAGGEGEPEGGAEEQ